MAGKAATKKPNGGAKAPAKADAGIEAVAVEERPVPIPATARRDVSERGVTADMEARNDLAAAAAELAGIGSDGDAEAEEAVAAKAQAEAMRTPDPKEPDDTEHSKDAEVLEESTDEEGEDDAEGPILPDEDDEETDGADDDDEDDEAEGEDGDDDDDELTAKRKAKALEKRNFKLREQKRELEGERDSLASEVQELRSKVKALETQPSGLSDSGPFAAAKTDEEVTEIESGLRRKLEWLEDLLDDHQEIYTLPTSDGEEREYSRKDVREERKWVRERLQMADGARATLQRATAAEQVARKRYPFVFDAGARHNGVVTDLVKETPELNRLPSKSLALGRMAIGKLVESGQYVLVKKATAKAERKVKTSEASPSPPPARKAPKGAHAVKARSHVERVAAGEPGAALDWAMELQG